MQGHFAQQSASAFKLQFMTVCTDAWGLIIDFLSTIIDTLQFRRRGYEMIDFICDYHSRVEDMPVRSQVS